jgi:hypothetical protein
MEHKTWLNEQMVYNAEVPTMLASEEKQYLYWLGKRLWLGEGLVVEVGPWLGGSTVCLAAGMKMSGYDATKKLHTLDNFIWREFMGKRVSLPIKSGESFRAFFETNIEGFRDIVQIHTVALPDEPIYHDPRAQSRRFFEVSQIPIITDFEGSLIEIFFLDGAKSWRGIQHLMKIFCQKLAEGKSYIVCQDYKFWGGYWIPVMMTRLKKYLEPVHNILSGDTVTFKVTAPIPEVIFDTFQTSVLDLDTAKTLDQIHYASSLLKSDGDTLGAAKVFLSGVTFLTHQNKNSDAKELFKQVQLTWPLGHSIDHLERARHYLEHEKSCRIPYSWNIRLAKSYAKGRKFLRKYREWN